MSLFTKSEITKKASIIQDISLLESDCMNCGLYKKNKNSKIEIAGKGKKKILIIGETTTESDEMYGTAFTDKEGELLSEYLEKNNINLHDDCWRIKAIRCYTANPTYSQLRSCYPYIEKFIKTEKPTTIFLLGSLAVSSLFGEDFSDRDILRWRKFCIPDQTLQCNIIPLFPITDLISKDKDKNLKCTFERDLKFAIECLNLPFVKQFDHEEYVTMLQDFNKLKSILKRVLKEKPTISYDYETTGKKPFKPGHKIVTISFSVSPKRAYSFPYQYRNFWTEKELKEIHDLWQAILKDPDIRKIAQNSKYEEIWGAVFFKARHKWLYDTLMGAHILDNRHGITGLKFQAFVDFGVRPYDKEISKFLKPKGEFNEVEKVPLKDLLLYNGLDCIYTHMLYKKQLPILSKQKGLLRAYNFFMRGNKEMASLQLNGFTMDVKHYKKAKEFLTEEIKKIEVELLEGREARAFEKQYNKKLMLTSNQDLGNLFYNVLGKEPIYTAKGNYKTDKPTLEKLNLPFIKKLFTKKKYEKALTTYIGQFEREIYKSKINPFFDLIFPVSYRSCIAKGTKILVARDFEKYPDGVPIEEVRKDDLIYCFDDNLNPVLQPVLWAGKTGVKQVVQIEYYRKGHGYDYLECTPEHRIRLINGKYVEAQDLLKKKHYEKRTGKSPNCHVLAGARRGDSLNFTNHLTNGTGIPEHRFIYSQLKEEELTEEDVIHHKNKNHLDHRIENLEKHSKSSHARLHSYDTLCSPVSRENNKKAVKKAWKEGRYDHTIKRGPEAHNWLGLTKKQCLFMLYTCKGKPKITSDIFGYDFSTFKKYYLSHEIEPKEIAIKFDKHGKYISKKRLKELSKLGRAKLKKILGHNHYRIIELYKMYGLDTKRRHGNQYGTFKPGNHVITGVKKLKKLVEVYDIEVKDHHNFFANEICVHNSSSSPNMQNQPKRDVEIKKLIRQGLIPRKKSTISEIDFSGSEVVTSASCHKDPKFISYLLDKSTDMHRDNATDLLMLPHETLEKTDYNKEQKKKVKLIRFYAKNLWTFAQFYGDWFGSCAPNFWEIVVEGGLELPDGTTCKEWLANKGIYELGELDRGRPTPGSFMEHCKNVENTMWHERFPVYTQWKKDIIEFYQKYGYIESPLGFKFIGYMSNNQCNNFIVQGTSFHLLLDTLIETQKMIRKKKLKTKIIAQVHDSIISNVPIDEIQIYHTEVHKIVANLQNKFKWLIVPMAIEIEMTKSRESNGSLAEMQEFSIEEIKNKKYLEYI